MLYYFSASRLEPSPHATAGTRLAYCTSGHAKCPTVGSAGSSHPAGAGAGAVPAALSSSQTPACRGGEGQRRSCTPHPHGAFCCDGPFPLPPGSTTPLPVSLCPCPLGCGACSITGPWHSPGAPRHPPVAGFAPIGKEGSVHCVQLVACNRYCSFPSSEVTKCLHCPPASAKPQTGRDMVWSRLQSHVDGKTQTSCTVPQGPRMCTSPKPW